jgi:CRP/FNR family cyclic AMP-dependent transcriptional regulator
MIDGLPRSASVVAVRDSTLSFVRPVAFWRLAEKNSDVYKTLVVLLTRRLRETDGVEQVQENRKLSDGDKQRLSDALYEFSDLLDRGRELAIDADLIWAM